MDRPEFKAEIVAGRVVRELEVDSLEGEKGTMRLTINQDRETISLKTEPDQHTMDVEDIYGWWLAMTKEESLALVRAILKTWQEAEEQSDG